MFNKTNMSSSEKGPRSKVAMRYGSFTVVVSIIAVLLLIGANWLSTLISDRLPVDIDLTSAKENSITAENLKIIKDVDRDVNITVCASEEGYVGEYMAYFAQNNYQAEDATAGSKYYQQTINLIKEYASYNPHINVEFIDPQETAFSKISSRYPSHSFVYGDILVESAAVGEKGEPRLDNEGNQITNSKFITYDKIYSLSDTTGYAAYGGTYTVSGNTIETQLTSAIYSVTSTKTVNLACLSGHSAANVFDTFKAKLELNNYNIVDLSDPIITSIPDDTDVIAIAAPTSDLSAAEIQLLETFLNNDGKRGKGLMFFAATSSPALPNLYAFLKEWGVSYDSASIMYETTASNYANEPGNIGLVSTVSPYTMAINNEQYIYIAASNLYMAPAYEAEGKRATKEIMTTSDTTVAVPASADASYDTSGLEKEASSAIILTSDTVRDEDNNELSSYVICFSSADFISATWAEYSTVGNMDMAVTLANAAASRETDDVYFSPKTITNESFAERVSAAGVTAVKFVLMGLVPLMLLGVCIFVLIRRKSR